MFADLEAVLRERTAEAWAVRETPSVDQWCDEHRRLPSTGVGANLGGRWNTDNTPYMREMLRATTTPGVREIWVQKSSQVGLTELLFNIALYFVAVLSRSLLIVYPTKEKGVKVNERRLVPAIRGCADTARLLALGGRKAATAAAVKLGSLLIWFAYTKSADSLKGDPVGPILLDEVDKFDYTGEDPLTNVESRQTTFDDAITVGVSTPTDDQAGITRRYDTADVRHRYLTPCSKCGGFFELFEFSVIKWVGGFTRTPEQAAASAHIRCPHCEGRINLGDHRWMVQHGVWVTQGEDIESDGAIVATLDPVRRCLTEGSEMLSRLGSNAFRADRDGCYGADSERYGVRIVGERATGRSWAYRINENASLISAGGIRDVVYQFVKHKGHPPATWWQERQGRSPSTKGDRVELSNLRRLCIPFEQGGHVHGTCPAWTAALFGAVDVQKDCVKVIVRAVGAEGKRWATVWTRVIPRDEHLGLADVRDQLADIGDFPVQGARRKLTPAFAVDSGAYTHEVYQMVYELQKRCGVERFILVKGMSSPENNPKPYHRSSISEIETADGKKLLLKFDMELLLVNGHYYKDMLARDLTPLPEETVELLRSTSRDDADFERMLDEVRPEQLPDERGWDLCDDFLGELTAEEKVTIGQGSGRTGKDGMGRLRRVWRKRMGHLVNDFFDTMVYSTAMGDRANVRDWTPEIVGEMVGRAEAAIADRERGVLRAPARRAAPSRGGTIAGDAAQDRIL